MAATPGAEQFRNAVVTMRNIHIMAGLEPLMLLREELVHSDDMGDRGGLDDPVRDHFISLLGYADRMRRRVTHNPDSTPLAVLKHKAIDASQKLTDAANPTGGDEVAGQSGGLYELPWDLSGADPNIPLNSQMVLLGFGSLLLAAVDRGVVLWTRLNSRLRSGFITQMDSMRIYGMYQQILTLLETFGGDAERRDVVQVLATEEPRGPTASPNRTDETVGDAPAA